MVYEQVPETVFWIVAICILLLGTIIATMMLFQYLIERNEDSRKQAILENQVEQLHREIEDIEEIIKPCGFYKNKAKSVYGYAKIIVEKYNGKLPQTMEELVKTENDPK